MWKRWLALGLLFTSSAVAEPARPQLQEVRTSSLKRALGDSGRLWGYLTLPSTPYLERRAAGVQGEFPLSELARLVQAVGELRRERDLHNWGLLLNPHDSRPSGSLPDPDSPRRNILGHPWSVPSPRRPYPMTWAEEAAAPWPWQVQRSLEDLLAHMYPHDKAHALAWLRACLSLPRSIDSDACLFVEACQASSHWKSLPILAAFRKIAMAKHLPQASVRAASTVAESARLWDDPDSQLAGEAVTLTLLTSAPNLEVRHQAAYGISALARRWHDGAEIHLPIPAAAVLASLKMATNPSCGDAWTRLYVYGFSACEALDRSPIQIDRRMDPHSPQVDIQLHQLAGWLAANHGELERQANSRRPALERVARLLDHS